MAWDIRSISQQVFEAFRTTGAEVSLLEDIPDQEYHVTVSGETFVLHLGTSRWYRRGSRRWLVFDGTPVRRPSNKDVVQRICQLLVIRLAERADMRTEEQRRNKRRRKAELLTELAELFGFSVRFDGDRFTIMGSGSEAEVTTWITALASIMSAKADRKVRELAIEYLRDGTGEFQDMLEDALEEAEADDVLKLVRRARM